MLTSLAINTGGLGRFGNNCFTIAGVIGTAIKSGQPYGFPEWRTVDNEIFGEKPDNINEYLLNPLPPLPPGRYEQYSYFWGYKDLYLPTGNWTIDAHMQSEKFFKHCMPLIRDTFRFKDEPPQNDYVAIHYRAGDYIDHPDAQHPRCSVEYYQKAIMSFPMDGREFMVFTDNIQAWYSVRRELKIPDGLRLTEASQRLSYIDSFKYMKKSKDFVCANSSFSLFAAILGEHPEKKIICPKRWFGSQMPAEFDTKDIYPENSIII